MAKRWSPSYNPQEGSKEEKYFSGGQPTLFMSFNQQYSGHTNPAYQTHRDDDDDENYDEYKSRNNEAKGGVGNRMDRNSNESNSDEGQRKLRDIMDNETPSTSTESSREFDPEENEIKENLVPNGGPRMIPNTGRKRSRVTINDLQESNVPPPVPIKSQQTSEEKWNVFRTTAKEAITREEDIKFWNKAFVATKFIICIFLFLIVLGSSVITKLCFIITTSNIHVFSENDTSRQSLRTARGTIGFSGYTGDINRTNVLWLWSLILIMGAPYVFIIGKCTWRLYGQMTRRKSVTLSTLLPILLMETLHSVALMVTVFLIIPSLDPISGLLFTLNIAVVPGLLKIWFPRKKTSKSANGHEGTTVFTQTMVAVFSFIAAIGQFCAIGLWCYHIVSFTDDITTNIPLIVCLICAPIFVSATWWENYVHQGKKGSSGLPLFARSVRQMRTKLLLFTALWKLVLVIIIPLAMSGISCERDGIHCIKALYGTENEMKLSSNLITTTFENEKIFGQNGNCSNYLPLLVAAVSIIASVVCFKTAKVACKIMAQVVDFSLPLVLSTPAAIGVVLLMYSGFVTTNDGCSLPFPHWNSTLTEDSAQYFTDIGNNWENVLPIVAGLVGFLSYLLVSNHIWLPGKTRLQRTDMLFIQPLYCGIFTEQSLVLNRRRVESEVETSDTYKVKRPNSLPLPDDQTEHDIRSNTSAYSTEDTPMIYMCATMWHENENEMTQLLKSIFRMDEDQCTRKNYQMMFHRRDPDYYEFEAHIFFDDAFESHKDTQYDFTVNSFVKELIRTIRLSACAIMGVTFKMSDPKKVATPYGGRLVWSLPGGNKLVAHLKDKSIIRHRKRWSQVMYMYYFLGYKLLNRGLKRRNLEKRAMNTFLLALDGDVDFHPPAVQLLVDRMKKNPLVGAACGRIHPVGNGAMVWYQKFEYAVSHWLQKAAEDKLGCVLCSPGCFSLFRGSALMDDNVMNKYTTPPTEPRHYVQYDQGEDRWLCTLLLQQGHRVEYCAASDALTYAPEGFYEFFNQRRRWTPSTMANILDLLTDWKNVTTRNPEISVIYVFYQGLLMASSILTPGTIFLLILGAINLAYPTINLWVALILNIIPVAIMVTLCFISKSEVQLSFAGILSTAYSLVMMIVLVGLLRQAADYGFCSVTTMFLLFVAGVFIVSALLHPQEFWCLLHGCLYFLAIPAMSMVLMLYSLGNLHVVTWGTRENKQPTGQPQHKKPQDKVLTWLEKFTMCCRGNGRSEDNTLRMILDRLDAIEDNLTVGSQRTSVLERIRDFGTGSPESRSSAMMMPTDSKPFSQVSEDFIGARHTENQLYVEEPQKPRDLLLNPYWMMDDEDIKKYKPDKPLEDDEITFWKELIDAYLKPLEEDAEKQKQTQQELIELRNKVCLIFILINSLFIIIVFTLQQVTADGGSLTVQLPCADTTNNGTKHDLHPQAIEPISVAFTLVFGILLLVQFLCMLTHRFATLLHICASTTIFKGKKLLAKFRGDPEAGVEKVTEKEITFEEAFELVREMQSNKDDETSSVISSTPSETELSELDEDLDESDNRRKRVKDHWKKLAERRRNLKRGGNTLNANFRKNFLEMQKLMKEKEDSERQDTDSDEESVIKDIKKKGEFKRFNHKSLRLIAEIQHNPSLKKSIAEKKLKGWDLLRENVLGKMRMPRMAAAAIQIRRISRQDASQDAVRKHPVESQDSNRTDPSESPNIQIDKPNDIQNKMVPEESFTTSEKPQLKDSTKMKSLTVHENQETNVNGNNGKLYENEAESEFKLQIPDVDDDEWPDEDQYTMNEHGQDSNYEDADTLF